ncbi:MAG TPA: fasciclin domain-containing protein [Pyrinomonadaceae bacterium]|nr:fasciclin domain-containing protein [Pyrinomonadaceae bacterium]
MKKVCLMLLFAVASIAMANGSASAQMQMNKMDSMNPMVGGAAMLRSRDIVDNAVNSADHTTLVAAVKAAGLVETLKSKGPFTVFAPTNAAFDKLPAGTVDTLVKPENKEMLTKILTYHVLAGRFDSKAIASRISKGHGKATFTTVSGDTLTATMNGNELWLRDEKDGASRVTIGDVFQSNGVIHVVDSVLLPN